MFAYVAALTTNTNITYMWGCNGWRCWSRTCLSFIL